jgi:hypothetical protein
MRDHNYPIYFLNNTCIACGAKAVTPVNKFDKLDTSNKPLYPIYRLQCQRCYREYFIEWKSSSEDSMELEIPVAVSKNCIDEFTERLTNEMKQLS